MDTNALQTLDAVVNKVFLKSKRPLEEKTRFIEFAIDGYRFLKLRVTRLGMKVKKITPNALNRYDYPSDMEEFIGMAIPLNGAIWYLTRRDDIVPTTTTVLDEETLDADAGEGVDLPTDQLETVYSEGGVNIYGYYTLDDENREIIINATTNTEFILFYISSGINNTDTTYIPSKYIPSLEAYIMWQDVVYDNTVPINVKTNNERMFYDRIRELRRIEAPSHQEMMDAWATGNALIK